MRQPQREISLKRVVAPTPPPGPVPLRTTLCPCTRPMSEFAGKWINLCAIHMSEGLRDRCRCLNTCGNTMWLEGNKRVSILKYFDAPTVQAEITRVVPQLDEEDPETAVYYAFLRYDSKGLFKNIRLSSAEKYEQLSRIEETLQETAAEQPEKVNYNGMFLQFEGAYDSTTCPLPLGDAFLEYLRVYGLPVNTTMSQVAERIAAMQPQMALLSQPDKEPDLLLSTPDKPQTGLFGWLFGQRKSARVVFAYPEGARADNWTGAHAARPPGDAKHPGTRWFPRS